MCYTGTCPYEEMNESDEGECRKPGDEDCPCIVIIELMKQEECDGNR